MNWPLIILGLATLASVTYAKNSYLVIGPKLFKVGHDNQLSVSITGDIGKPVEIKFDLKIGQKLVQGTTTCKPGETRNFSLSLPNEFPVGPGELIITGTGGLTFEEKRDIIVYDNRHVLLVQTSAASYQPYNVMEIRVLATNENLIPIENGELTVEIYDSALKLVGQFTRVPIRSGLTETLRYQIGKVANVGTWLVTAVINNTTSSVEVLVSRPITPSFDLQAIFPRFFLRTEKFLRGFIEIKDDYNTPIFGRGLIAIGPMIENDIETKDTQSNSNEWHQWKSQQIDIAGRLEINYDLLSQFNIDVNKVIAVQVYIQVTDLTSGHERVVRLRIPVFARDIIYDIRPLEFQAGINNEFEIIAKRPDGKPIKMEDMIVTVKMFFGKDQDEKIVEIKDFYTRGRNDIGFFNIEVPENCVGVLMTMTPLDENGQVHGYRTQAIPLLPIPGRREAKLTIELLPFKAAPVNTDVNVPVVSSQISTVGRTSNFYIQLLPSKSIEKFEKLPMSYILMSNGRIILSGEFNLEPTKQCQTKTVRTIQEGKQSPPTCFFNGTLSIQMTRDMVPYSTLLVYTFKPSFGFNVAESYRFSVAGLFQSSLVLNSTIVPYAASELVVDDFKSMEDLNTKPIHISNKVQDKTRIELSLTGVPDSLVGLNVIEYDAVLQGLTSEITKERLLKYLTIYEQVPTMAQMPIRPSTSTDEDKKGSTKTRRAINEQQEDDEINRERMSYKVRYPLEKIIFGLSSSQPLPVVEGDDIYTTSNMARLYDETRTRPTHYRRKLEKSTNQYDVTVDDNTYIVATSVPLVLSKDLPTKYEQNQDVDIEIKGEQSPFYEQKVEYGTELWYEKFNSRFGSVSQEAFKFMYSGLVVMSDFESLYVPKDLKYENLTMLFAKFRQNEPLFNTRDEARQLLEEYIVQSDLTMIPQPIMLEELSRIGHYRSLFFNTTHIGSQGVGKVVLPRTKPYSTWLATGFALNSKSGLSIAQPIRLPTNQGLFIIANSPRHIQVGEHGLITYTINNHLGKDITNVILRIRSSPDFDLIEESQPEVILSSKDKDYSITIPSFKALAAETRNIVFVPKRTGLIQIVMEVESEFGGDYEILNPYSYPSDIQRKETKLRLFDLTGDKTNYGPIVTKFSPSSSRQSFTISASGSVFEYFAKKFATAADSLIGIDSALARLYRSITLRRYLTETSQTTLPLYNKSYDNIITAYQQLQLYNDYDGSYSFVSDEGTTYSSLYLTSLAFGAMISPMMPFHDFVTLNRTLTWILSRQQEDGSFYDDRACFHRELCEGEFRRESLTALVLYSLTRDNVYDSMPEFIRSRLFNGENSPINRAQRYLRSRVIDVMPNLLTITLFEVAFIQNKQIPTELRDKIHKVLVERKLTVVPDDNSKYIKLSDNKAYFEDQLLLNAMTVSLYSYYDDFLTSTDIARWIVSEIQVRPYFNNILDAIFHADAWLRIGFLYRKKFGSEKLSIEIDFSTDNGEKQQFKIDSNNWNQIQKYEFTLPVNQLTYTVKGFGFAFLRFSEIYSEKQQNVTESSPFELSQEFKPTSLISEINAKTCLTYQPTSNDKPFLKENYNRTIVVEVRIPSGMHIDLRRVQFMLSRIENILYFTYNFSYNKLTFFINVPSTLFGKPICLDWCLERLSDIISWKPIQIRAFDYFRQGTELIKTIPIDIQPQLVGYSYIEAVQKARTTLETSTDVRKERQA